MLLKEESTHEKYAEFQRKTGTQHITVPDTHGDDARQGAVAALLAGIEAVTY